MRQCIKLMAVAMALAGCGDDRPEHYYVFCGEADAEGWKLVNSTSENGYIRSCTYQSPDQQQFRTLSCTDTGCD